MSTNKNNEKNIDVFEHKQVYLWLNNLAKEETEKFILLTGNNLKQLQSLMGKPSFTGDGKSGWTHAWTTTREGLNFIISASDKQTIYYLQTPVNYEEYLSDSKVGISIIEFLTQLLKDLRRE